jgi:hypothetical protein
MLTSSVAPTGCTRNSTSTVERAPGEGVTASSAT